MISMISAGIVAGASLTHRLGHLPESHSLIPAVLVFTVCLVLIKIFQRNRPGLSILMRALTCLAALMLSMCWTIERAQQRLNDMLDVSHENVVSKLTVRVTSMAQDDSGSQRFEAYVLDPIVQGIPRHIQVVWQDPAPAPAPAPAPSRIRVLPGQSWHAAVVLKRPHGATNPYGFDYEGLMFQRNIRAIGKIRGTPRLITDAPTATFGVAVARVRHHMREAMRRALGPARYGPVMIALAIGDQDSVAAGDWEVFNRTGITHLVSISGSHVTMIGAMAGMLVLWLCKRLRVRSQSLCERVPARTVAALAAMLTAFLYCLLAGWGVPARRTFLMLAVVATAIVARVPVSLPNVLGIAAAAVTIMDPWSPISTGFWLSFMAVGVLFLVGQSAPDEQVQHIFLKRLLRTLIQAVRLQWWMTLAMVPVIAFLFQQVSFSSPLANAVAIPAMTFIVTPLALLTALLAVIPGGMILATALGWLGHLALSWSMRPVQWLAQASWATQDVCAVPVSWFVLAIVGMVWALQSPGLPARWAGWCLMLPALVWQPDRPRQGDWKMWVMDVGQGAAVLIQTEQNNILIDTGQRSGKTDSAQRVLIPALRALGVRGLHQLIVSHADTDHAGGLHSLMQKFKIDEVNTSFDAKNFLLRQTMLTGKAFIPPGVFAPCASGQFWERDGVRFSILHPSAESTRLMTQTDQTRQESPNARSCVLHVQGRHHSVLLPGDIGVKQELMLMMNHPVRSDVVVMPHHGSHTSSSIQFVEQADAQHAVAQVGYLNRFGHPKQAVLKRWASSGARLWRTDHHGAIFFESTASMLSVQSLRLTHKRYWHHEVGIERVRMRTNQ